ncbi:MAG: hypothetical protein HY791_36365 [Deltaproteobacteria bacterium]|nr:hypothetical protein [Deltaproteobacteria bacterium]
MAVPPPDSPAQRRVNRLQEGMTCELLGHRDEEHHGTEGGPQVPNCMARRPGAAMTSGAYSPTGPSSPSTRLASLVCDDREPARGKFCDNVVPFEQAEPGDT